MEFVRPGLPQEQHTVAVAFGLAVESVEPNVPWISQHVGNNR